jgi:hypothetical protein
MDVVIAVHDVVDVVESPRRKKKFGEEITR